MMRRGDLRHSITDDGYFVGGAMGLGAVPATGGSSGLRATGVCAGIGGMGWRTALRGWSGIGGGGLRRE